MSDQSVKLRPSRETRHEDLIEAAFALFLERGFAATRLEDVAVRAGVAKGTVVVHFPTKEALFTAVVTHYVEPTVARAEAIISETGTARERLIGLARFIHEALCDPHVGGIPKMIVAETGNFPDLARGFNERVCDRSRTAQIELIRQGIAAGEFRAVDPDLAARLLLDPLIMHAIWKHSLGRYEAQPVCSAAYLETHLDIFLRGIAAET